MLSARTLCCSLGAVAILAAAPLSAQDVVPMSVTGEQASKATKTARTAGLILASAAGAQLLYSPDAWPQTFSGFGQRVADQVGFYAVQKVTFRSMAHVIDYRQDAMLCPRSEILRCSVVATFTAFDRRGQRNANWPLLTSVAVGTGASLLWRPERADNNEAWAIFGKRIGLALGGYVAERVVLDWWAQRRR